VLCDEKRIKIVGGITQAERASGVIRKLNEDYLAKFWATVDGQNLTTDELKTKLSEFQKARTERIVNDGGDSERDDEESPETVTLPNSSNSAPTSPSPIASNSPVETPKKSNEKRKLEKGKKAKKAKKKNDDSDAEQPDDTSPTKRKSEKKSDRKQVKKAKYSKKDMAEDINLLREVLSFLQQNKKSEYAADLITLIDDLVKSNTMRKMLQEPILQLQDRFAPEEIEDDEEED
jgi:hypothetical protein